MVARVALVTGAAQGIGYAIAIRLAKDGLNVAVNDILAKRDKLDAVVNEIKALGRESAAIPADVTSEAEVKNMVDEVVAALGGLDVLVANAGVIFGKPFLETTIEEYDNVMAVNARGVFNCYQSAARQMISQGRGGKIIGACSIAGVQGVPGSSAYGMSKFAVRGLTQTVAQELRPYNIAVNAYAPGIVKTELMLSFTPPGLKEEEAMAFLKKSAGFPPDTPHTEPIKIASVVSFLANADSSFISGQTINVDGGIVFS